LQFVKDGLQIAGVPVLTSIHVDAGTVAWGIDTSQQRYVLRSGTTVEQFPSFTNDGVWVRGISCVVRVLEPCRCDKAPPYPVI
jgi:hypothetical protein